MLSARKLKRAARRRGTLFPLLVSTSLGGDIELSLSGRKPLLVKASEVPLIRAALELPGLQSSTDRGPSLDPSWFTCVIDIPAPRSSRLKSR